MLWQNTRQGQKELARAGGWIQTLDALLASTVLLNGEFEDTEETEDPMQAANKVTSLCGPALVLIKNLFRQRMRITSRIVGVRSDATKANKDEKSKGKGKAAATQAPAPETAALIPKDSPSPFLGVDFLEPMLEVLASMDQEDEAKAVKDLRDNSDLKRFVLEGCLLQLDCLDKAAEDTGGDSSRSTIAERAAAIGPGGFCLTMGPLLFRIYELLEGKTEMAVIEDDDTPKAKKAKKGEKGDNVPVKEPRKAPLVVLALQALRRCVQILTQPPSNGGRLDLKALAEFMKGCSDSDDETSSTDAITSGIRIYFRKIVEIFELEDLDLKKGSVGDVIASHLIDILQSIAAVAPAHSVLQLKEPILKFFHENKAPNTR